MNTEENTPQQPDRDAETQRFDTEPAAPAAPAGPQSGRRRRNILIGAAATVAILAVGGGAYAIGAEVGDDDDDRPAASQGSGSSATDDGDRDGDRADDGARDDDRAPETGAGAGIVADAASMRDAAEAAIGAAGGTGASSIDVEHGGYEVEVLLADGSEVDVFVGADGAASVDPSRDDDRRADPALDLATLGDIIDAALAASSEASGGDGTVDAVSSSDDQGVAYEVSIRLADGRDADIDLAADLALVFADVDDD
ncbi:putative membrane protein YkoI [Microbacterium natoriense]|uniref:Membrane protein YkoI n=1 Tax=Microbacterium natoriense TaxID=284570 RepID=A0AAW8ESY1_9MICO|nr:hypothetical protein [Microbacterium natoriense]MDQ0646540.1 putative membrane protein YkoI [Microbacterium natoriense]